jgi:hypothetical protein
MEYQLIVVCGSVPDVLGAVVDSEISAFTHESQMLLEVK